jgi:hypothetical protein
MAATRADVAANELDLAAAHADRADLLATRDRWLSLGDTAKAAAADGRIAQLDDKIAGLGAGRDDLVGSLRDDSNGLVVMFTPESLTATLDGRQPVAMLPVRIETRFDSDTHLRVRVFPDQVHVDAHDPALTADEAEAGRWYWSQRWTAGLDDTEAATAAWTALCTRFRPGRAAYVVAALTPTNTPADGVPAFTDVASRGSAWSRAPMARALPDRLCAVGLRQREDGGWDEVFRRWADNPLPDELAVGPDPHSMKEPEHEEDLPVDEGTRWLREPQAAYDVGALIEIDDPALAGGVDRLVVLGVDWTRSPEEASAAITDLLHAHRYAGHLGFVAQGTPTNNTSQTRSGFSSDEAAEIAALDPVAAPASGDAFSAGTRLAGAFGLDLAAVNGLPGANLREHAWASSLVDVLWRATAGYYLSDLLDPLAQDPAVDADLREFTRGHVFASGPLPTLRAGAQPYGLLPVVSSRSFEPNAGRAEQLVHRVASTLRSVVRPALDGVPRLGRAGESGDLDTTMLALLQRTPVPWTFRFRPLTGPVERKALGIVWERLAAWQQSWTAAVWAGLQVSSSTRLNELTADKRDYPLPVPLVAKPGEPTPTGYLAELADLLSDPNGRTILNLREDSAALLEALAACSGVLELDRCTLALLRHRLALDAQVLATLPSLSTLSIATPPSVRVEAAPTVPLAALDFRSGRQLAETVVPEISTDTPLGRLVPAQLAESMVDLAALMGAPTDPFYWLANQKVALQALATAPPDQLEWAFRGYLDLFATRLDAWFTGLASSRLTDHRAGAETGVHLGCWGVVEDLRRDQGPGAESLGFVHTPSLSHAVSTALLRNGRLTNRGDDGAAFDLQITAERTRTASWLLDGVTRGQSLAALLGYRLERRLRESGLKMMRYQMPLRRTAPLRGPDVDPDTSVETLTARDVVDGVALIDRWRSDQGAVLDAIARQAGLVDATAFPQGDADRLRGVIAGVDDAYDAVSDLLVAESVHQAALGNLEKSGAALEAHDRHGRAPDLDFIATPRAGHTVAHRVGIVLQGTSMPGGWPHDARGNAEPLLDAWVARVLGDPKHWVFGATARAADGSILPLDPVTLADLGLGPISTALASAKPGQGRPTELAQRLALAFAAFLPADDGITLDLHVDAPTAGATGGLALLETLGSWLTDLAHRAPLTAADFTAAADVRGGVPDPGTADTHELGNRVTAARTHLGTVRARLAAATTDLQRSRALLDATAYAGTDAVPQVPVGHQDATTVLDDQVTAVVAALDAIAKQADDLAAEQLPTDDAALVARHTSLLRTMLGEAQPVLPRWLLGDSSAVAASQAERTTLLGGDPTAAAIWLHRSALVRPQLDPLTGVLLHLEAGGADVADRLTVVQQPHRPGAVWHALEFGSDAPPHGSVGLVLHGHQPFDPAKGFAGVLVDAWTETVPAVARDTAVTFHYDAPGAAAPQAVLLAVHPAVTPETWSFDLLLETVNEAVDLAHLRTLSAAELAPLATFLPALYLPDDYTRDVPSVSFVDLVKGAAARGITQVHADVVGKG